MPAQGMPMLRVQKPREGIKVLQYVRQARPGREKEEMKSIPIRNGNSGDAAK